MDVQEAFREGDITNEEYSELKSNLIVKERDV